MFKLFEKGKAPQARALFGPIESERGSSFLSLPHFLRRTGDHFAGKCSNEIRLNGREFDALVGTSADMVRMFNELVEEARLRGRPRQVEQKDVAWLLDSIQDIGRSALTVYRRMLAESDEQGELRFNSTQQALLVEPDAALLEAPQAIVRSTQALMEAGAMRAEIVYDLIVAEVDVVVKRWMASASIDLITKLKAGT